MKKIIRYVFFIMLAIFIFKCASSSLNTLELNLAPQKDTVIEIRPFSEAKKHMASKGFKWRGALTDLVDKKNGLYTSFDDEDYADLRHSLVRSLRESQSFKAIHDIQNEDESFNGIRLYLCFDESGVRQTSLEYVCFLNACAWTATSNDSLVLKKEIKTKGKSNWSASGAQQEAIEIFIKEVAQLISIK